MTLVEDLDRAQERLRSVTPQRVEGERWLSPDEAAERTPLSRKAIYGAIRRGELPATKRVGRWMIAESDLAAWIAGGATVHDREEPPRPRRQSHRSPRGSLQALRAIEARGGE